MQTTAFIRQHPPLFWGDLKLGPCSKDSHSSYNDTISLHHWSFCVCCIGAELRPIHVRFGMSPFQQREAATIDHHSCTTSHIVCSILCLHLSDEDSRQTMYFHSCHNQSCVQGACKLFRTKHHLCRLRCIASCGAALLASV